MNFENFDVCLEHAEKVAILPELREMFAEGDQIWQDNQGDFHFRDYVAADVELVFQALAMLKDRAETFLEWGSGLGLIASSAGRLGYRSCGIEIDPKLYRQAQTLADKYSTGAEFSFGSFVPDGYELTDEFEHEFYRTILDEHDGYGELDMELRDFDLVYAYPWPAERQFFVDVMRQCGRRGALFMTYDVREGIQVEQI
jgi:hypothetical protein